MPSPTGSSGPSLPPRRRTARSLLLAASALLLMAPGPPFQPHSPPKKVKIINGPSQPVPVVEVGDAETLPFQDETQIQVSSFLHEPLYTVPLGYRAKIETVTVLVTFPVPVGAGGFVSLQTTLDGEAVDHHMVLTTQGTVLTSEARTANHAVSLYADPGSQVFLDGAIQAGSTIFVSLSGELEALP